VAASDTPGITNTALIGIVQRLAQQFPEVPQDALNQAVRRIL
jgi:hypothetical protein